MNILPPNLFRGIIGLLSLSGIAFGASFLWGWPAAVLIVSIVVYIDTAPERWVSATNHDGYKYAPRYPTHWMPLPEPPK